MLLSNRVLLVMATLLAAILLPACSGCGGDTDPTCTPGESGCECNSDGNCDAGLVCGSGNTCQTDTTGESGLVFATASARACELLFEQTGTTITNATWGDGVRGVLRRRPPRVAIAVTQTTDRAFATGDVNLEFDGPVSDLILSEVRCFDSAGALIADATVTLR